MHNQDELHYEINFYDLWKIVARRKYLILLFFVIAMLSTIVAGYFRPNVYRGEAILLVWETNAKYEIITSRDVVDIMGKVDKEKLSKITPNFHGNVEKVKFINLKDSKNKISVTIDSRKIDEMPKVFSDIVSYLNDLDIIKSAAEREKTVLSRQSAELKDLVKSSAELVVSYYKLFKAGKISTVGFNPIDTRKSVINMKMDLMEVDQKLARLKKGYIKVIGEPYIASRPISPRPLRDAAIAGTLSVLLGILLAVILELIWNANKRKSAS